MASTRSRSSRRNRVDPDSPGADLWQYVESDSARALLMAALEAFAVSGFHGATTRQISEKAGLSPAGVYVHYKSKTDLLYEIARIGHRAALSAGRAGIGSSDDSRQRMAGFIHAFAKWHADHHTLARVVQYELRALPLPQFRKIKVIRTEIEQTVADLMDHGTADGSFEVADPAGTASAALSLCIDLARWYTPSRGRTSDDIGTLYSDLVLRMLNARAGADAAR